MIFSSSSQVIPVKRLITSRLYTNDYEKQSRIATLFSPSSFMKNSASKGDEKWEYKESKLCFYQLENSFLCLFVSISSSSSFSVFFFFESSSLCSLQSSPKTSAPTDVNGNRQSSFFFETISWDRVSINNVISKEGQNWFAYGNRVLCICPSFPYL